MVEEPTNDDNSICLLHEEKMRELKIFNGDPILLKGKRRNKTLLIAVKDNKIAAGKIAINKVVRANLKVKMGDLVTISPAETVPDLTKIHVLPY
jgi:transitional endoplasmic reticulum ATPase